MRWGLVPSWAKDSSVAAMMINARSETASTKPASRDALKSRRCLIPADVFYERQKTGKAKQPYCFEVNEQSFSIQITMTSGSIQGMKDVGAASEVLRPSDARLTRCYPVRPRINNPINDDEECSAPVDLALIQARLFS
jgi:putative SOS response-associated peptidase YedK